MAIFGNRKMFDEKDICPPEEKCIWTCLKTTGLKYKSGCITKYFVKYNIIDKPYCPYCGGRIEIKNAN